MKRPKLIVAANHIDNDVRLSSSSGGVFFELSSFVINKGGAVIGAAYCETSVKHIVINSLEELWRLQKSKYAPSSLFDFKKELPSLVQYPIVLFSGVPCQVKGVKYYLRNASDKVLRTLYTKIIWIEIACHGVPTLMSYRRYISSNNIIQIDFRCKRSGWKKSEIEMTLKDGTKIYELSSENGYYRDFHSGKNLRAACLSCKSKYFSSGADFTLADFWGVEAFACQLDDDRGTSLVLIHNKRGKEIWDCVSNYFVCQKISLIQAIKWNPCVVRPLESPLTMIEIIDKWKNSLINSLYYLYKKTR